MVGAGAPPVFSLGVGRGQGQFFAFGWFPASFLLGSLCFSFGLMLRKGVSFWRVLFEDANGGQPAPTGWGLGEPATAPATMQMRPRHAEKLWV